MKTTAPLVKRRPIIGAMFMGAVLALGAALWVQRGPDLTYLPDLAEVHLPQGKSLYVQVHEVTLADWNRCFDAGACALQLRPPVGRAEQSFPATGISWIDANDYIAWINRNARHRFRLPTTAEWLSIAAEVIPDKPVPIFASPNLDWASAYLIEGLKSRRLEAAGSYSVTKDGVADLDGNVWEWTQDCFNDPGLPSDRCPAFYVMGEHEAVMSFLVRDPARGGCAVGSPPAHLGMRLVTDSKPGA